MAKHESLYNSLKNQWVTIQTSSSSYTGKIEEDTHETIILRPSVIGESEPFIKEGSINTMNYCRIEEEIPTIVDTQRVEGVRPISEKYMREYAQKSQDLVKQLLERG